MLYEIHSTQKKNLNTHIHTLLFPKGLSGLKIGEFAFWSRVVGHIQYLL